MAALIAWPVIFAAGSYNLRVSISGVQATCAFTVTAGRYYWVVGDAQADADGGVGGVGDLLDRLRACIASHPSAPTVTVALDANFRVRVSVASGTVQILWASGTTTLQGAPFGFSQLDTGAALAITGDLGPHGLWRPLVDLWNGDRPTRPIVGGVARALSGRVRVSRFGTMPRERTIPFDLLLRSVVLDEYIDVANPTGALEYAWNNSLSLGRPFRLYADETSRTLTSYRLMKVIDLTRPWERSSQYAVRWAATLQAAELS